MGQRENKRGRFASAVREEMTNFIREEGITPLGSMLTVSKVFLPEKGSVIKVYVSFFPPDSTEKLEMVLKSMENRAAVYLGKKIVMKKLPVIRFIRDTGEEDRERISRLLEQS